MFLQSKVSILLFEEIKHQKSTFISLNWSMILLGKWKLQFQTFHSHYLHIHTRNNLFITCSTYFVVQINLTPRYCSLWTIIFVWLLFVWTKFISCVVKLWLTEMNLIICYQQRRGECQVLNNIYQNNVDSDLVDV